MTDAKVKVTSRLIRLEDRVDKKCEDQSWSPQRNRVVCPVYGFPANLG